MNFFISGMQQNSPRTKKQDRKFIQVICKQENKRSYSCPSDRQSQDQNITLVLPPKKALDFFKTLESFADNKTITTIDGFEIVPHNNKNHSSDSNRKESIEEDFEKIAPPLNKTSINFKKLKLPSILQSYHQMLIQTKKLQNKFDNTFDKCNKNV